MPLLEQIFNRILDRHESLRTAFISINGVPRQKVAPPGTDGYRCRLSCWVQRSSLLIITGRKRLRLSCWKKPR